MRPVTRITSTAYQSGSSVAGGATPRTAASAPWPSAVSASTIVMALSHEKLPLTRSQDCVTMMRSAATLATGCGAKRKNGTTSCAKWFPSTSTRWSGFGR